MAKMIEFFVPGTPASAGSKTVVTTKDHRHFIRPASKFTKPWMDTVRYFARKAYQGLLLTGPIQLTLTFVLVRPKSHYGTGRNANKLKPSALVYPTVMPDLTKVIRAVEDALTNIIWRDDKQVVAFGEGMGKIYGQPGGVRIKIEELEEIRAAPEKLDNVVEKALMFEP